MGVGFSSDINKMTKRISAFILIILMIVIISACSGNNDRTAGTVANSTDADTYIGEEVDVQKSSGDMTSGEPSDRDTEITDGEPAGQSAITEGEPSGRDTGMTNEKPAEQSEITEGEPSGRDTESTGEKPARPAEITDMEPTDQDNGNADVNAFEGAEEDEEANIIDDKTGASLNPEGPAGNGTESRALEGRIICIDPGHQTRGNYDTEPVAPGADEMKAKVSSGTAGVKTRIPEYKLVLEVALKLRDVLEGYGATVIMTRTENNVDISNAERAAIANDANADLYFRIHADGSTDKSVHGVSVLIPGKGYITDEYVLKESEKAGSCILEAFVKATGAKRRGMPKRNDLSGFNWCKVPMALIEIGFMSNAEEDVKLNSKEYQDKMVDGMAKGIVEYFINN